MDDANWARLSLIDYRRVTVQRDRIVTKAHAAGITKAEIHRLTGLSRDTIDRILSTPAKDRRAPDAVSQQQQTVV